MQAPPAGVPLRGLLPAAADSPLQLDSGGGGGGGVAGGAAQAALPNAVVYCCATQAQAFVASQLPLVHSAA